MIDYFQQKKQKFRLRYLYRGASSYTTQLKSTLNDKAENDEQNEQVSFHLNSINSIFIFVEKNSYSCV